MVARTIVVMTDDLDGSEADQTVRFSLGPFEYEIDLSTANADALRDALRPYVAAARRISGRVGVSPRVPRGSAAPVTASAVDRDRAKAERAVLRDWAQRHGIHVNDRGRIPDQIISAFKRDDPEAVGGKRPEEADKPAEPGKPARKATNGRPVAKKVAAAASGNGVTQPRRSTRGRPTTKSVPPAVFQA